MVEMLVVLLILAILLALVVGISRYVMAKAAEEQTVAIQRIVMLAIERYRDTNGGNYPSVGVTNDCSQLMNALVYQGSLGAKKAAKDVLRDLPKEAWAGGSNKLFDGYGKEMRYEPTGGLGGVPLLISCGADRKKNDGGDRNHADNEDNIYSDEN